MRISNRTDRRLITTFAFVKQYSLISKSKRLPVLGIFYLTLLFSSNLGAQVSYLGLAGGFEGGVTIDNTTIATAPLAGKWTKANATQTISLNSNGTHVRSGGYSLLARNNSTTGRRVWSPLITIPSTTSEVTVQYYVRRTNGTNSQEQLPGIVNNTEGLAAGYTAPTPINSFVKVTYTKSASTFTSIAGLFLHRQIGTSGDMYIDDMCVYTGPVDDIAPLAPTNLVITSATSTSVNLSWDAASGGTDGGGYLVQRTSSNFNFSHPLVNAIYDVGSTVRGPFGDGVGIVRYIGASTSFTDNDIIPGVTYSYRVYTYDKAYNYSEVLSGDIICATAPTGANKIPNVNSVCEGTILTLGSAAGGGTNYGCTIEYRYSNDGGLNWSAASTTIPSFAAGFVNGTQTGNFIQARRNNCAGVCTGPTTWATVAYWYSGPIPASNNLSNQTYNNGQSVSEFRFSGNANTYSWTNSDPSIGLAASGTGIIPSFVATNNSTNPITATITVTPSTYTGYAYIPNNSGNVLFFARGQGSSGVLNTGGSPRGIAANRSGTRMYVSSTTTPSLMVFNTATNTEVTTIFGVPSAFAVAVSPDESKVYVTNSSGNTVTVINALTNTITGSITVGANPVNVVFSPDGSKAYVANAGNNTLSVINTSTNAVTNTVTGFGGIAHIAITPDGSRVYASQNNPAVAVVNTSTNAIIASIPVAEPSGRGVAMHPDGSKFYAALQSSIAVISTSSNTVLTYYSAGLIGSNPIGISIDPANGSLLYVCNNSSNNVSIINTVTNTLFTTVGSPGSPYGIGNFLTGAAYDCVGTPQTFTITVNPPCTSATWTGSANSNWNNPANWSCNEVPAAVTDVIIPFGTPNQPHITASATCKNLTIDQNATLFVEAPLAITGATTVNGVFWIDNTGATITGSDFVYASGSRLQLNSNVGAISVEANSPFWPNLNGPENVRIERNGGASINAPKSTLIMETRAGIMNAQNLTVTSLYLNTGGFVSGSPTYTPNSSLIYSTGGTYGRAGEWLPGTTGPGHPKTVSITNNTILNLANGLSSSEFHAFNFFIQYGSTLSMDGPTPMTAPLRIAGNLSMGGNINMSTLAGGDIYLGGNLNKQWASIWNFNGRTLILNGTTIQQIYGDEGFGLGNVVIDKPAEYVQIQVPLTISNLSLVSGKAWLLNCNLVVNTISGGSNLSYVYATPNNYVTVGVPASPAITTIPIGTSSISYDPVSLSPTAGSDFTFKVSQATQWSGFAGPINNPANVVERQWDVAPLGTPGLTTISFTNGGTPFTPAIPVVGHYTGSAWDELPATYSNNSWTTSTSSFSPFAVGSAGGFVSCETTEPAGTYISFNHGDWSDPATWQVSNGCSLSAAVTAPGSTNNVIINHNVTLSQNSFANNVQITGNHLDLAAYRLTLQGGIDGHFNASATNSELVLAGTGSINSATTFHNAIKKLKVDNGGPNKLEISDVRFTSDGIMTYNAVMGTFTLNGAALRVEGDVLRAGTGQIVATGTGEFIEFTGNLSSSVAAGSLGTSINSIEVNKLGGANVALNSNISITETLSLGNGILYTLPHTIKIEAGASVVRSNGWILGKEEVVVTGAEVRGDIGTPMEYTPATIVFTLTGSASGSVLFTSNSGDHPSIAGSGLDMGKSVNAYWTITNPVTTPYSSYDLYLGWPETSLDPGVDPGNLKVGKFNAPNIWTLPAISGLPTSTTITATGLTGFSDFIVAEEICSPKTIASSAGPNGSISPAGNIVVNCGADQAFTITANAGYTIADVLVDGISQGAIGSYTFTNVTTDHTISASFASLATYTITATAGANGTITPAGTLIFGQGANQTYSIIPNAGYIINDVKVDNTSVGAVGSYTFNNITANHTIEATFIAVVLANPALVSIDMTDLSNATANPNLVPYQAARRLHIPILNLTVNTSEIIPAGTTKVRIDLGSQLELNTGYDVTSSPLNNYFNWSSTIEAGHVVVYGDQYADIPGDFFGITTIDVKGNGVIGGSSTITTDFLVTNHNNTLVALSDIDPNNNQTTLNYTELNEFVLALNNKVDILCNGYNTGSLTVQASGGSAPYQYQLNAGPFVPGGILPFTFNGLTAGTYTVTSIDAIGQTSSINVTITEPSAITFATPSISHVTCFGYSNGSIISSASGGTGAISYTISPNIGTQSPAGTFSGLTAGTYTITATDANNCTASVIVEVEQPVLLELGTPTISHVSCYGGSNGSITIVATGGTGTINYSISPATGSQPNPGVFAGLIAGTYTITATDANGCTATTIVTVTEPADIVFDAPLVSHLNCFGDNNGSISVLATGGTGLISYSISPNTGSQNSPGVFTGLVAGTYVITATDINNCTETISVNVDQPQQLLFGTPLITHVYCNAGNTGAVTVSATGGTGTIIYTISPNIGTQSLPGQFTGLITDTYTITATDANNCTATQLITISEPPVLTATASGTNIDCYNNGNGTATVTVGGGTAVYNYNWVATAGGLVPAGQENGQSLTGLIPGVYTVTVTDANGCTATSSYTVTQPDPITALQGPFVVVSHVTCNGAANGSIDLNLTVQGGTPGYTYSYSWTRVGGGYSNNTEDIGGLTPGTYNVVITVTDLNNCTAIFSIGATITEPAVLGASVTSITHVNCAGNASGSVTITATGGTTPYEFSINGGTTWWPTANAFYTFNGLVAGPYTVIVKDANGCLKSVSFNINQPNNPDLSLGSVFDNNIFLNNADEAIVIYNIAELAGKAATPATLRIFKPAGYDIIFNGSQASATIMSTNYLVDNTNWTLTNTGPNNLYFDFSRTGAGNTINCNELVRIAFKLKRNTPNISAFNLNAQVRIAGGELILSNNTNSIIMIGE